MAGDAEDFREILKQLSDEKIGTKAFKSHQVKVVNTRHPLHGLLDDKHCQLPILLVADVQCLESPVAQKVQADDTLESLEGSPLKLQTFSTAATNGTVLVEKGTSFNAIPADEARWLLGLYNEVGRELLMEDGGQELLPLWVLCDGEDWEHLAYMASHIRSDQDDTCVLNTYMVKHKGGMAKSDLPLAGSILREHKWRAASQKTETSCSAEYAVFGTYSLDNSLLMEQSSVNIKLQWQDLRGLLSLPPQDARAYVELGIVAGNVKSAAKGLFEELEVLKGFVCGLKEGVFQCSKEGGSIMNNLHMFMEVMKMGDAARSRSKSTDNELEEAMKKLVLPERHDMDFTEQLWNVLKDVSSYQDLCDCLHHVLNCLKQGDVQPMVHKSNKSQLAQLVRDSYYGKMTIPRLAETMPIELLAEIAIEKLLRDYMNAFIGKDLVTGSHLQFFTTRDGTLSEQMERLERLHYCLEVVVLLEQYLKLPQTTISASARHVLKYYEEHPVSSDHTFTLPVQTSTIMGFIERCNATHWKCVCCSQDERGEVITAHALGTKSQYSHVITTQEEPSILEDGTESAWRYYWTCVEQTTDVL